MPGKRILIRAPKSPDWALSAEASLAYGPNGVFGSNAGNMLFAESVYRTISVPDATVVADSYSTERPGSNAAHAARIDEEFDAFVVPLANAFREQFRPALQRLTTVIQHLTIPVVVTGIGAQLPPSGTLDDVSSGLRADAEAFMTAVLAHSSSVGVRGEMTALFLEKLGFGADVVDVIGCPSMFDFRGEPPVVQKRDEEIGANDPLALNITPTAPWAKELLEHHLRNYPRCVYVPQEHPELALLLWGQQTGQSKPGMPTSTTSPWVSDDRVRFFVDPRSWREFMETRVFAFGHRIHGNIAALAAGTPACVLTFDSRTTELADYHGIPHFSARSLNRDSMDVRSLYEESDFTTLNARRAPTRDAWLAFLDKNGVDHLSAGDPSTPAIDQRIEAADLPGGVGPGLTVEVLNERVRWLWNETRRINPDRYSPPFAPTSHQSVDARLTALQKRCDRLSEKLQALAKENEALQAELGISATEPTEPKIAADTDQTQQNPAVRLLRSFKR